MTTYFDTSALLKLVIEEPGSDSAAAIWDSADSVASVSITQVEVAAAMSAAYRAKRLTKAQYEGAKEAVRDLVDELFIVEVSDSVVGVASALAESHALRGYDAVQLAAAVAVDAVIFCSSDTALCEAARRNGMFVANPLDS